MKKNDAKRSQRRAEKSRMKAKARIIYPHDQNAKNADHLAACSCHMCGNPRKFHKNKKTLKEKIASFFKSSPEESLKSDWETVKDDWNSINEDWLPISPRARKNRKVKCY